jgi:opacity protein-like surface antigen
VTPQLRKKISVNVGAQMRKLTSARSVSAEASSIRSFTRNKRKGLILAGAMVATLSSGSGAWAQCVTTGLAGLGADFVPLARGSAVNSIVSVVNTMNTAFLTQSTAFVSAPGNAPADTNGGGVWSRGIGGVIDLKNTGTLSNVNFFGVPFPGDVTCQTQTRLEFGGFQAGADIARLNFGNSGANFHIGATAGFAEAKGRDVTAGGTFSGNFQVPFAGLYAAFTHGGLFIDGQLRFDFYQNRLTDPVSGLFGQEFDGRGVSVTGNIGYQWGLANGWFLEPSIGVIHSRVTLDPLNVAGTFILGTGISPPGTVQIAEIESTLGRASLRVGTNFTSGGLALQPFVTASVFHEFAGNVATSFTGCFDAAFGFPCGTFLPPTSATLDTSRVGTYGQFALGIAGQIINTGWLGYVRADYRTGEHIDGWSVNGGIRYQFSPEPVVARAGGIYKSPVKAPLAGPIPVNWTGFYVGLNAGSTWGETDWTYVGGASITPKYAGFLGGGQVGYNYQFGSWVAGLEGDFAGSNGTGARSCPNLFFFTCEVRLHSLGTATARLGFAWDRTLFYAKGGFATGELTLQTVSNPGFPIAPSGTPVNGSSAWAAGWTVGGGFEYALNANWSAKGEFLYYDLGTERFTVDNGLLVDGRERGGIARVGVNYRFGWTPAAVIASY